MLRRVCDTRGATSFFCFIQARSGASRKQDFEGAPLFLCRSGVIRQRYKRIKENKTMNIEFKCPQCGQMVAADEAYRGQVVQCPKCEKGIVVPRNAPIISTVSVTPESTSPLRLCKIEGSYGQERGRSFFHPQQTVTKNLREESLHSPPLERPNPFAALSAEDIQKQKNEKQRKCQSFLVEALVGFIIVSGFMAGLLFFAFRSDSRYDAIQTQIDNDGKGIRSEIVLMKNLLEKKVSKISNRLDEIEKSHVAYVKDQSESDVAIKNDLESISRRLDDVEDVEERNDQESTNRHKLIEEKYAFLVERIEGLSRRISQSSSERFNRSVQSSKPPQDDAKGRTIPSDDSPSDPMEDLQRQFNKNLSEITSLRNENPSCYLNPDTTKITNLSVMIAPKRESPYSVRRQITIVRDRFYCTGCKKESTMSSGSPCCNVSKVQSFNAWKEARKNVDVTSKINSRITELYRENASLKKRIRTVKQ